MDAIRKLDAPVRHGSHRALLVATLRSSSPSRADCSRDKPSAVRRLAQHEWHHWRANCRFAWTLPPKIFRRWYSFGKSSVELLANYTTPEEMLADLLNKASYLEQLKSLESSIAAFDAEIARFVDNFDTKLRLTAKTIWEVWNSTPFGISDNIG